MFDYVPLACVEAAAGVAVRLTCYSSQESQLRHEVVQQQGLCYMCSCVVVCICVAEQQQERLLSKCATMGGLTGKIDLLDC